LLFFQLFLDQAKPGGGPAKGVGSYHQVPGKEGKPGGDPECDADGSGAQKWFLTVQLEAMKQAGYATKT